MTSLNAQPPKRTKHRMTKHTMRLLLSSITLGVIATLAQAADDEAARLSKDLTPLGAEVAASSDGVIPAWVPPGAQGPGWSYGKFRGESWKYKDDKPLYSINASNYQKYIEKLSPGSVEMFKKIKDFRVDVYPTRRSCGVPDFVAENTKKNIGFAKLDKTGFALEEAYMPGIPFPLPKTGIEAMWNMKMRYRGVSFMQVKNNASVSPRTGSEEWLNTQTDQYSYYPWGEKGSKKFSELGGIESYVYFAFSKPAALAGQAAVMTLKAAEPAETFYYFPGQKRVRRMPVYSYDAPQIGLDNQYNVDESNVFFGGLDRFDWKLVGKKEMIVQYNSFGLYNSKAKFEDIAKRDFIAPESRRYETHRVWVIEATVRNGMRHVAPKRLIYIDEDSWSPVMAVDFDAQGKVWKVREGSLVPAYETGTCDVEAFTQYNLNDGRYLFDLASLATGTDHKWIVESAGNQRFKPGYFTSDSLRSISDR